MVDYGTRESGFRSFHVLVLTRINTKSDKITKEKWSLNLSSTANEVRAFGNVYPCTFSGLIWVESY